MTPPSPHPQNSQWPLEVHRLYFENHSSRGRVLQQIPDSFTLRHLKIEVNGIYLNIFQYQLISFCLTKERAKPLWKIILTIVSTVILYVVFDIQSNITKRTYACNQERIQYLELPCLYKQLENWTRYLKQLSWHIGEQATQCCDSQKRWALKMFWLFARMQFADGSVGKGNPDRTLWYCWVVWDKDESLEKSWWLDFTCSIP